MQHPQITYAEAFGSLWDIPNAEYIGKCTLETCRHKDIYSDFDYWTDFEGHLFCCREHAGLYGKYCQNQLYPRSSK